MYNYHDPDVSLGDLATGYGRYRPLLLNAAVLGVHTSEQKSKLGIGRPQPQDDLHPSDQRYASLHDLVKVATKVRLEAQDWSSQLLRNRNAISRRLQRNI